MNYRLLNIKKFILIFIIIIILNIFLTNLIKKEKILHDLNVKNKVIFSKNLGNEPGASVRKLITTFKELEKKYGQLAIIKLKNGKEYIGAFYADKDDLVLITVRGKIVISSSEVGIIMPYEIKK